MYMDGDNDLSDSIYENLLEIEAGLYSQKKLNPDTNVKIVCLYDGIDDARFYEKKNRNRAYKNVEGTFIFELGYNKPLSFYATSANPRDGLSLLANDTKNLTSKASFLSASYNPAKGSAEANMADYNVLKEFVNWASQRYQADNVVLMISDHGSGVYSNISKALCVDYTSSSDREIETNELSKAFADCKIGDLHTNGKSSFDVLIFDACFESCLEEIYQIRKYTDYVVASPQQVPGDGFPYGFREDAVNKFTQAAAHNGVVTDTVSVNSDTYNLISMFSNLSKSTSAESFGREVVRCYANYYADKYRGNTDFNLDFNGAEFFASTAVSLIKTSSLESLAGKMDALAKYVLQTAPAYQNRFYTADYGYLLPRKLIDVSSIEQKSFDESLGHFQGTQAYGYVPSSATNNFDSQTDKPIYDTNGYLTCLYYKGSYAAMVDIGYMMRLLYTDSSDEGLRNIAKGALDDLNNIIVTSWRRYPSCNNVYVTDANGRMINQGLYPDLTSTSYPDVTKCYGLTILGASNGNYKDQATINSCTNWYYNYPIGYRNWSEFGKTTDWWKVVSE